eukprot:TRINITY_DN9959_c0_g1_i1.p1 TRINITY_DN9959_c0_g1~~TRINITY_DN9959_c0_g1_i1.p1  ORF type:complete len:525 (+),score=125.51 TRINITY_DN9959_c0_g1_i1:71-1645(+)
MFAVHRPTALMARRSMILRPAMRCFAAAPGKFVAPPMTYISGEEMSMYTMQLILDKWVNPFVDTSKWEYFDLSCKSRDATDDKVLHDAVASGKRLGAIFKEPTITPTTEQVKEFGLKKAFGSPNGAMRRGWNGITISRDTIHIPGIKLGFERPVFFERHAVGGEYGASWKGVGKGKVLTTFWPEDAKGKPIIVDGRQLADDESVVVVYDNPLDNVEDLAHVFFARCLEAKIIPYVVTKKTVFKWQEGFWQKMKKVFDADYKDKYLAANLLPQGELVHLISDAATMQIIRWTGGGFGMACHNYDGDMLTDEVAQVHRSPGFITSNLIGKNEDGSLIKEFEASHGTVADLYHMMKRGEETSMNPLGMVVALLGAMDHAASLNPECQAEVTRYTINVREAVYEAFRTNKGTRDLCGKSGLTTEQFVDYVASLIQTRMAKDGPPEIFVEPAAEEAATPSRKFQRRYQNVDDDAMKNFFSKYDTNGDGSISFEEFVDMTLDLGIAPLKQEGLKKHTKAVENHAEAERTE